MAQNFALDIKQTLYIHDTASSVGSEIEALKAFEELVKEYPNEWLPSYWTAYLCTQIARLKERVPDFPKDLEPSELMQRSQKYMDKAVKIKGAMTSTEKSDFHMLQGFIHGFHELYTAKNEEEKSEFVTKRKKEYNLAIKENPKNPLMHVLIGIDMTGRDDKNDLIAGIAMLDYAGEVFERESNRGLTTYWNKDFIGFWRSRAEQKLQRILAEQK